MDTSAQRQITNRLASLFRQYYQREPTEKELQQLRSSLALLGKAIVNSYLSSYGKK